MITATFIAFVLACGEPPPSGKDIVVSGGPGKEEQAHDAQGNAAAPAHVENAADFDKFAFPCCKDPAVTAVAHAYVDLAEKLAADDAAGSTAALTTLHAAAVAASTAETADEAARQQAGAIATSLAPLQGQPIDAIRVPLADISVAVISLARDQQGGDSKLVSAFCPMAPGHWLQRTQPIRNPYYGAEMLACGTLEAVTEVQ